MLRRYLNADALMQACEIPCSANDSVLYGEFLARARCNLLVRKFDSIQERLITEARIRGEHKTLGKIELHDALIEAFGTLNRIEQALFDLLPLNPNDQDGLTQLLDNAEEALAQLRDCIDKECHEEPPYRNDRSISLPQIFKVNDWE